MSPKQRAELKEILKAVHTRRQEYEQHARKVQQEAESLPLTTTILNDLRAVDIREVGPDERTTIFRRSLRDIAESEMLYHQCIKDKVSVLYEYLEELMPFQQKLKNFLVRFKADPEGEELWKQRITETSKSSLIQLYDGLEKLAAYDLASLIADKDTFEEKVTRQIEAINGILGTTAPHFAEQIQGHSAGEFNKLADELAGFINQITSRFKEGIDNRFMDLNYSLIELNAVLNRLGTTQLDQGPTRS